MLLVVGLPGETRAAGQERTHRLRSARPDRLRCIPFEPTGGHPVFEEVRRQGLLPSTDKAWMRELYRPLQQAGLSREEYLSNWSDALLLLAEQKGDNSGEVMKWLVAGAGFEPATFRL